MRIKKAVITAAGERQRRLPLQELVDRDGKARTVLAILVNDAVRAEIEEICIVVRPGDESDYLEAVPEQRSILRFVEQPEPLGYGDAIWRARNFVGGDAFLHLVSDHLFVGCESAGDTATALLRLATAEECCVSAVRPTHESLLRAFGAVSGQPVSGYPGVYRVQSVLEKPTPTLAEQKLVIPSLRAGHYLAFFGMHLLTPLVMEILDELLRSGATSPQGAASAHGSRVTLSDALAVLARREKYLALEVHAERFDLGSTYGLLTSQLALALSGQDRAEILSLMVQLLANEQLRPLETKPQ
ncbi:MAG: UTP--glucose-1-phosphate uridylyltransferase [Bryobacterales bacterium]|nr:UTP--glucose-1-phosphate uridylyltransferase [Bryobacterales bacterium]